MQGFHDNVFYKRSELEARFPTLVFHFFKNELTIGMSVRVMLRDIKCDDPLVTGGCGVVGGQMHEEIIQRWVDFPTPDFIARCALIA